MGREQVSEPETHGRSAADGSEADLPLPLGLVSTTWERVAAQQCCLDDEFVRWYETGPDWPRLLLNPDVERLDILSLEGEHAVPGLISRRLFDLLADAEAAGAPIVLPKGRRRVVNVDSGVLVAVDRGEWGGGLYFVGSQKGGKGAVSIDQVDVIDEELGVVGVVSRGGKDAVVLQRGPDSGATAICLFRDGEDEWRESARFPMATAGVLGADDVARGGDAPMSSVVATIAGDVLVVSCDTGASVVASLPFLEIYSRWRRPDDRAQCINLMLEPLSARRYADGTVAVTTRHTLALVEFDAGKPESRWFVRPNRCR